MFDLQGEKIFRADPGVIIFHRFSIAHFTSAKEARELVVLSKENLNIPRWCG